MPEDVRMLSVHALLALHICLLQAQRSALLAQLRRLLLERLLPLVHCSQLRRLLLYLCVRSMQLLPEASSLHKGSKIVLLKLGEPDLQDCKQRKGIQEGA